MKLNKKTQLSILLIISLISIGFAYLSANLDVFGVANIKPVKWNIYFNNVDILKGEKFQTTAPTAYGNQTREINFEVALEDPGDSYSFSVDVVNDGTVDAMISLMTNNTELTPEQQKLYDFDIKYIDGNEIKEKNLLTHNTKDTFLVTVSYKRNINIEDLPEYDNNVNFSINLDYVQAKDSDLKRTKNIIIEDLSVNHNNGKLVGATLNEDGTVTTDGVNDYVDCGLGNVDFKNSASLVVRFKINKLQPENHLLSNNEISGFAIFVYANGYLGSQFYIEENKDYSVFTGDKRLETDVWYTAVTTYDGNKIKLYLNGSPVSMRDSSEVYELPVSGNIRVTNTPLAIGANPYGDTGKVNSSTNATFSSALIFNRALTDEEIARDYAEEVNPTNTENLLVYYNFR